MTQSKLDQAWDQTIRDIERSKTPKPNLKETLDQFLLDSHLQQIHEGKMPASSWPAAAAHDEATLNAIASLFVSDLNLLLRSRQRYVRRTPFQLHIKDWTPGVDDQARANYARTTLRDAAYKYLKGLVDCLQPRQIDSYYNRQTGPTLPLSTCKLVGDVAVFSYASSPSSFEDYKLVNAAYHPVRETPDQQRCKPLLEACGRANFRYSPCVLAGIQTDGFTPRQAFVLRTGLGDIVLDTWGLASEKSGWPTRDGAQFAGLASLSSFLFAACVLLSGMWPHVVAGPPGPPTLGAVAYFFLCVVCTIGSFFLLSGLSEWAGLIWVEDKTRTLSPKA